MQKLRKVHEQDNIIHLADHSSIHLVINWSLQLQHSFNMQRSTVKAGSHIRHTHKHKHYKCKHKHKKKYVWTGVMQAQAQA